MNKPTSSANRIILGTVQFGLNYGINNSAGQISTKDAFEILSISSAAGVNMIDTADGYGNAELVIGKFLAENPNTFHVNTKFKFHDKLTVKDQLQRSLDRLRIDNVDVYFYHDCSDLQYPEVREELYLIKEASQIKKVGVSVYTNEEFRYAIGRHDVDVIQIPFNLIDNYSQRGELIAKAKAVGKEIQVRSVFLQGLFFKPLSTYSDQLKPLLPYIKQLLDIKAIAQVEMEELALAYVLAHADIDKVVIGIDTLHQLQKNLSYRFTHLEGDIVNLISSITVKETELLYPRNWK